MRILLCALAPAAAAAVAYSRAHPDWTERVYSLGFYQKLSLAISSLTARVPWSVAEWLVGLLIVGGIAYLVFWIRAVIRCKGRRLHIFWEYLFTVLTVCAVFFAGFVATCGLNYYRYSFTYYSGLELQPTAVSVLRALSESLVRDANALRQDCAADDAGVFLLEGRTAESLGARAGESMALLGQMYDAQLFRCGAATTAKPVYCSELLSRLNLLGEFCSYTMEANVNVHPWNYEMPSTMCHELAHVCGFMREDEANFIAYRACMSTGDRDFMYSGTMLALIHTTNALYARDRDQYRAVMGALSDAVWRDLSAASAYWKRYDTAVAKASNAVNDAYLKANAQADGVSSYGRMVDLLIAQYLADQK